MMHVAPHIQPAPVLGVYIPGTHAAATYYRLRVPLKSAYDNVAFVPLTPEYIPTLFDLADSAELIVLSRVMLREPGTILGVKAIIERLQRSGARVVVDQDDDLLSRREVRRAMSPGEQATYEAFLRYADRRTTTNRTLAQRFRQYGNTYVLPNYVRTDWTPLQPIPDDEPVVITITGSPSHEDDWRDVAIPLHAIRIRYGNRVHIRSVGYLPEYLHSVVDDHTHWSDLANYLELISGTHIGLAPLLDTSFNRCKSPIKAYEYGIVGAAVVASPMQYAPVLADGRGITVGLGENWTAAISTLIEQPERRRYYAQRLQEYISSTVDGRRHAATIRAAYGG